LDLDYRNKTFLKSLTAPIKFLITVINIFEKTITCVKVSSYISIELDRNGIPKKSKLLHILKITCLTLQSKQFLLGKMVLLSNSVCWYIWFIWHNWVYDNLFDRMGNQ